MRLLSFILLAYITAPAIAQLPLNEQQFFSRIKPDGPLPGKLLSTRTAVFYPYTMTTKELESIQAAFQRTGVDAVVYFENDLLTAGRDVAVATAQYLLGREISNLVLILKNDNGFNFYITTFNGKANFVEQDQPAWTIQERSLEELLRKLYRTASNGLPRENFLINDYPETGLAINPINGRRADFYAIDLKVDPLAVPKFGDPEMDRQLEEIMKSYPFKYTLTEANLSENELRKQGSLFVLRFVHARARVAKRVLGYSTARSESAIVSITYPDNQPQVKNISADAEVYKFYFKHIDSDNVYLGTKWDADLTWQQALINQLKGMKLEMKIN